MSINNNLSILFSSHSKAYDIWHITNYFFDKYWDTCSYKKYLGANGEDKLEYCPEDWNYINNGEDKSWSKSLISYLDNIDTKYILLFVDDTILLENVNNKLIEKTLKFIIKNDIHFFRLYPNPGPDIKYNSSFGLIDVLSEVPYITSWNNVIWNKEFLIKLLQYDFNPWQFETKAGKIAEAKKKYNKFFSVYKPIIHCGMFVEKGKFCPFIKDLALQESQKFDFTKREFLSKDDIKDMNKSYLRGKVFNLLPNKYKNKIRKFFKKESL